MRRRSPLVPIAAACLLCLPAPAAGQREIEPYQWIDAAVGWGAIAPADAQGLSGDAADAGTGLQLAVGLQFRQGRGVWLYARADADNADVRQHLGVSGGVRVRLARFGRIHPYAGGGGGVLWLEPRRGEFHGLDREFVLRGEGFAGAEWAPVPELRWFAEYRVAGARFAAIGHTPECPPGSDCLGLTSRTLHVAHTGWVGLRIKMF